MADLLLSECPLPESYLLRCASPLLCTHINCWTCVSHANFRLVGHKSGKQLGRLLQISTEDVPDNMSTLVSNHGKFETYVAVLIAFAQRRQCKM
jgi:hypothetical protein